MIFYNTTKRLQDANLFADDICDTMSCVEILGAEKKMSERSLKEEVFVSLLACECLVRH